MSSNYFFSIIIILLAAGVINAQIPQMINYQAMLTDADDNPINGSRSIQFRIYDSDTGGNEEWSETHTVSVSNGFFSVLLGSTTPIPYSVFDGTDRYLSIQVESDPEMTPRKRLVSVGYAMRSYDADKVDGKDASVMVQKGEANSVTSSMVQDNIVSSINGVSNDGGNIDLVAGSNITITPDDANNQITISASGSGGGDNLGNHTATQNINLNGHWLSGDGNNEGVWVSDVGNVGIGTANPYVGLHVKGLNGVLFEGTNTDAGIPTTGPGTRLMWYPAKGALRAGAVGGNQWDADSIGYHSIAMGIDAVASADGSVALGLNTRAVNGGLTSLGAHTIASGVASTAMGIFTKASGFAATSLGESTTASGNYSVAIGQQTEASGPFSLVMGQRSKAGGDYALSIGYETDASGHYSTALGIRSTANNSGAVSIGSSTIASGGASTALGNGTTASGGSSTAMGTQTIAAGFGSTAMGFFTTATGQASTTSGYQTAARGDYSFTAGINAKANHRGCFVWSGYYTTSELDSIASTAENQFIARSSGGVYFYTNQQGTMGVQLGAGGSSWSTVSDSSKKENFQPADGENILQKISGFSLGSWNYKQQDPVKFRHYGPMAQDFFAAFGHDSMGTIGNDTTLSSADFDGINFIAIKALEKRTTKLKKQLSEMQKENSRLNQELQQTKELLIRLSAHVQELQRQLVSNNSQVSNTFLQNAQ